MVTVQWTTNYDHQPLPGGGETAFSVASAPSLLSPPQPLLSIAVERYNEGVTFLLIFPPHPLQPTASVAIALDEERGRRTNNTVCHPCSSPPLAQLTTTTSTISATTQRRVTSTTTTMVTARQTTTSRQCSGQRQCNGATDDEVNDDNDGDGLTEDNNAKDNGDGVTDNKLRSSTADPVGEDDLFCCSHPLPPPTTMTPPAHRQWRMPQRCETGSHPSWSSMLHFYLFLVHF